ncbi:MAG: hypothetical protein P8J32_02815 [bacterium]|nr:hypothetical protein [bacterium]
MKKLVVPDSHHFLNGVNNQPPDVTKKVSDAVIDYLAKEFGVEREKVYAPVYRDNETLVGVIKTLELDHVFHEENQWGMQDLFMIENLKEAEPIEITFGLNGNVFIAWFEEIEALDRSEMTTSPIDKDDHLMTMDEWIYCCECGGFIDYDGFAEYSDGKVKYGATLSPSDLKRNTVDKSFSHVVWYNR